MPSVESQLPSSEAGEPSASRSPLRPRLLELAMPKGDETSELRCAIRLGQGQTPDAPCRSLMASDRPVADTPTITSAISR